MPSSIRIELDKLGFDWDSGRILFQHGSDMRGWEPVREVKHDDKEVTQTFSNGAFSIDLPRAFAQDESAFYLPYRNQNGAGMYRVSRDLSDFLDGSVPTLPYPT